MQRSPLGALPRRRAILVGDAGLVDKHQLLGVQERLTGRPFIACSHDVGALLPDSVRRLFL